VRLVARQAIVLRRGMDARPGVHVMALAAQGGNVFYGGELVAYAGPLVTGFAVVIDRVGIREIAHHVVACSTHAGTARRQLDHLRLRICEQAAEIQ
jgi:hypothetical protein